MTLLKRLLTATLLICLLAQTAVSAQERSGAAQTDAKRALEKLKTLTGSWQGEIMQTKLTISIRPASSGTAVVHEMHTEGGGPPNHEITMFYIDGERLLATHYCDAGNRSLMEGKISEDGKTIKFTFIEVVGSKRGGYLKGMTFTFAGADLHVIEAMFVLPNGEAIPLRGEFKKTGLGAGA